MFSEVMLGFKLLHNPISKNPTMWECQNAGVVQRLGLLPSKQKMGVRFPSPAPWGIGATGAHLLCKQEVTGSNPVFSTIYTFSSVGEHRSYKSGVAGSSPARCTMIIHLYFVAGFILHLIVFGV